MPSQRFDEYHHNLSKTKIEKNYFFTIWGDIVLRNCTRSGGLGKVTFSEKNENLAIFLFTVNFTSKKQFCPDENRLWTKQSLHIFRNTVSF